MRHLTTSELAERLQVAPETVRSWRVYGTGPSYLKFGRGIRYRLADVEAWEQRQLVRPRDLFR
jgi:predicted DNA-binding transcriptional regulator AlpA